MIEIEKTFEFDEEMLALNQKTNEYEQIFDVSVSYSADEDAYSLTDYYLIGEDGDELVIPNEEDARYVENWVNKEIDIDYEVNIDEITWRCKESRIWDKADAQIDAWKEERLFEDD